MIREDVMTTAADEYDKTLADLQTQFPKIEGNAAHRKHFENGAWFGYQLAVADIERLTAEKAELLQHVELGPEQKKDPVWALLKIEIGNQGYRKGYDQAMEKSRQLTDRLQNRCVQLEQLLGEGLRNHYFDEARASHSWLEEALRTVSLSAHETDPNEREN
jgi:hypothetical protein